MQFSQQFAIKRRKCLCCCCKTEVLRRGTQSEQPVTICAWESLGKHATSSPGVGGWRSVGFSKKKKKKRKEKKTLALQKVALQVAGGVSQQRLQAAAIVAKSRTGFYLCSVARNKKRRALQAAKVSCYTAQFFSKLLENLNMRNCF